MQLTEQTKYPTNTKKDTENKPYKIANLMIIKTNATKKLFKHHQKPVNALNTRVINSGPFAV